VYGTDPFEQTLDIYFSNEIEGPFPVVLMLHQGNGRKEQFVSWGLNFAKQGYAVVASNYRGWPGNAFPQDISDAFCALAWIHDNAEEYNFDTGHVFVLGHSSGGTLAALIGVVDDPTPYLATCPQNLPATDWVQGAVTFTGIFDYVSAAQSSSELGTYAKALLNSRPDENPEIWAEASAITWIDGSEPPFLVFHGGDDQSIPQDQSTDFARALEAAGVPVELIIVPEADHVQITGSTENIEATLTFLSSLVQK
jgi:acetyl esterase/lipase